MPSRFGEAKPPKPSDYFPNGIYPWEIDLKLREMQTLDDCSKQLETMINLPVEDSLFRPMLDHLNLLWVVSEDEIIYLCHEMLSTDDPLCLSDESVLYPRKLGFEKLTLVGTSQRYRPKRVGHGAMLNGQPGRICGEICLQNSVFGPVWEINNSSGRYGRNCGRVREELEAVANEFKKRNIYLKVEFYG